MTWRKWLVRGLVFSVVAALALAAVLYQVWTNPAAVRKQVLDKLHERFRDGSVSISLESAQLRLLGGIAVSELRISRSDGLDKRDFLYVPSAVIYHDKERLLDGAFAIRKVELQRAQVRLVRDRDGRFNLSGLFAPCGDPRAPVPTVVLRQGTILLEDQALSPAPLLEIKDVNLTALEDPPGVVCIEASGQTDVAGPVRVSARVQRGNGEATATVEATAVPVEPPLIQRLTTLQPEAGAQLRYLRGRGTVVATLAFHPGAETPLTYDVTADLHDGEISHARLPVALEGVEASVHCVNGRVPLAHVAARAGAARLEATLKDLVIPKTVPQDLYDLAGEIDCQVDHLPVTDDIVKRLPDNVRELYDLYKPAGVVAVTHTFRRNGPGKWRKHWLLRSEGMEAEFIRFPYKVERVSGFVEFEQTSEKTSSGSVDLVGYAGGRRVTVKGTYAGPKETGGVDIDVTGDDVLLDEKLYKALPEPTRKIVAQFLPEKSRRLGLQAAPMGRATVKATIHRTAGKRDFANRFVIDFRDASVQYDVFPLPLDHVRGRLDLQPDHWECIGFHGTHKGGEISVDGHSSPLPGRPAAEGDGHVGRQDRISMTIQGDDIEVDEEDFENALSPPEAPGRAALRRTRAMLALAGRMSFKAVVDDLPGQPQDIDVSVSVHGCTARPQFFPFPLDQVGCAVRYVRGHVFLTDFRARHGESVLSLKQGHIALKPGGGFQARLEGLKGAPLKPDDDFLKALPPALQRGWDGLKLRDPIAVEADMVVDAASEPGGPLVIWWDGGATLRNAALRAGVELTGVDGQVSCCGLYNGRTLEKVVGNLLFARADLFGQPFRNIHSRLEVLPGSPEVLRFRDLKADLFGGSLGGEARVEFVPTLRYDVILKALQVDLNEFARHNKLGPDAKMEGPVTGQLHLTGDGADVSGLKGNGRIDVAGGKLYRLPLLLDLLKAFSLHLPDRTMFEQVHMLFAIDGPQMQVEHLDLLGSAVSLRGQGTADLDGGNLNLDFSADWGRVAQVLPPGVADVPRAVSDQLLRIKMRGRIGDVRFEKELAPGVVEPLLRAWGAGP